MNPLQSIVHNKLRDGNISKVALVRSMGYKNTAKGIRRLEGYLENGKKEKFPFTAKIPEFLNIPPEDFHAAERQVLETKKRVKEQFERKNFKPSVVLRFNGLPKSIWVLAMCPEIWKTEVPEYVKNLPYDEEIGEVLRIYRNRDLFRKAKGFTYFRTFDESIDFDKDGSVQKINQRHLPEPRAFLALKK